MFAFYNRWKYLFYVVIRVYKMGILFRNALNNLISDFWYIRMGYIDSVSKQFVHNIIWINGSHFAVCKAACKMSTKMRSSFESQKIKLRGVIYVIISIINVTPPPRSWNYPPLNWRTREFQLCTIEKLMQFLRFCCISTSYDYLPAEIQFSLI